MCAENHKPNGHRAKTTKEIATAFLDTIRSLNPPTEVLRAAEKGADDVIAAEEREVSSR